MTDLTEQWKKGELEQGWYYINSGDIDYKYSKYNSADFFVTPHEDIKEVLAPVPSYEEWQATETSIAYNELAEENEELKTENKWYSEQLNESVKQYDNLKELLKKLHREVQEIVLYSHDIEDIDQEDWFTISRRQADIANNIAKDIYNAIGADNDKK